ncbi:DUF4905 domain-containing protein [Pontibacter amylolyticus]|uniref:DUF4905 domain-containing protein n=1 Tax=Pontibacter amylolyticus TaxID=1424080 RepID=A0ABQ1VWW7_9BACT|nr:DUF4905 domain-containing protein [Pontibacter amylolyticus]GGG02527.1 hypothetical protein GCM10011323_04180 [Pontibacter amylolyticus]
MWRIRLDAPGGWLTLEVRDADLLQARFYTLRLPAGQLLELKLPDPNTWWMGLEDVHDRVLYLHGYGDRKLGQHKGIRAFAADSGIALWQQPELAFYGIEERGLLVSNISQQGGELVLLESGYGKTIRNDITQKEAADRVQRYHKVRFGAVQYPHLYREGETYYQQVHDFLVQELDCEPVNVLEYAETDTWLVVSYYRKTGENKLDNFLAVFDLNGFLHLNELLAGAMDGVGSDTFFIFMRSLYFVQNKTTLKAYSL